MKYFGIREMIPCVGGHCTCDAKLKVKNEKTVIQVPGEVIANAIAPAGFRIQVPGFKRELNAMAAILVEQGRFDQLILYPTFLHVSYKHSGRNRGQILRKVSGGYRPMTRKEVLGHDD